MTSSKYSKSRSWERAYVKENLSPKVFYKQQPFCLLLVVWPWPMCNKSGQRKNIPYDTQRSSPSFLASTVLFNLTLIGRQFRWQVSYGINLTLNHWNYRYIAQKWILLRIRPLERHGFFIHGKNHGKKWKYQQLVTKCQG